MHYALVIGIITLYIYFRFGKKALAVVLAAAAIFALIRGAFFIAFPLLALCYFLTKGENWLPKLSLPQGGENGPLNRNAAMGAPEHPTLEARFIRLFLNAKTGDLSATIKTVINQNQAIEKISNEELLKFKHHCEKNDKESAALLYAYLDKAKPNWVEILKSLKLKSIESTSNAKTLSKREAFSALGLAMKAPADEIKKAHRELMKQYHPDQGGAPIIAAKLNMAKDQLL